MIANDPNNDEYKFDDLDLLAAEPEDQKLEPEPDELSASGPTSAEKQSQLAALLANKTVRNGFIAVGGVILFVFLYQVMSSVFYGHKSVQEPKIIPVEKTVPQSAPALMAPVAPVASTPNASLDSEFKQKLSALAQNQNVMSANIDSMSHQLSSISTALSDLTTQLTVLNNGMNQLNHQLDLQAQALAKLEAAQHKKHVVMRSMMDRHAVREVITYSIQAAIPGRAWLISNQGNTLTVREGTSIPGYGVVKLIDSKQGRVITSSGRVIRFSQIDS
jgi:intracellular multiplication protein IcmG